jgi:carbon starvation protein
MYRIRKGKVIEASVIGGVLTLGATFLGGYLAQSSFAHWFELTTDQVKWSMAVYGFAAAVLPVWILLVPRDYLSSFLKIGTIAVLVIGTIIANPKFETPAFNHTFFEGGPIVRGKIFPFLFITIMCGAISGFHALIASGTTSKMLMNEVHARTIGYGAMLIEGLVAVVAMIAAASLPVQDYYAMNTEIAAMPAWHDKILDVGGANGIEHLATYESLTQESLRGRTGGAVTLAVGMANIFDKAASGFAHKDWLNAMWKYWYHFAIMFEALFILTTIDAGTRVGRFLLQEMAGKVHPKLGLQGGVASAVVCTALIVLGWVYVLGSGSFATLWAIFGIANQMLAVLALGVVTSYLVNTGRGRFAWVTIVPMAVVYTTTTSAAVSLLITQTNTIRTQVANTGWTLTNAKLFDPLLQATLNVAMITCTLIIISAVARRVFVPKAHTDPQQSPSS